MNIYERLEEIVIRYAFKEQLIELGYNLKGEGFELAFKAYKEVELPVEIEAHKEDRDEQ